MNLKHTIFSALSEGWRGGIGAVRREAGTRGDWDECGRDLVKMQGKTGKSDQSAACVKRKTDAAEVCIGASVHLPLNKRVCVSQ